MTYPSPDSLGRRTFLKQASLAASGAACLAVAAEEDRPVLLPTIELGTHKVSRLIIGGNPIYGHSHFNKLLSQHLTAWHTPERVVEMLKHAETVGINTWQNSYAERTLQDLDRYRAAGGTMHWLCLGKPDWDQHPERIDEAARRKPIGIAPHGAVGLPARRARCGAGYLSASGRQKGEAAKCRVERREKVIAGGKLLSGTECRDQVPGD